MCRSVVNTNEEGKSECPYKDEDAIECPQCIFDVKGKPAVSKANKILIALKE